MIKILDGVKETVSFEYDSTLLLYNNTDYEEYPNHWHPAVEIVMPLEGEYSMECNDIPFNLRINDIIIICPGVLHHLYAHRGRRIIFQVDLSMLQSFEEYESIFAIMQPAVLVTPEEFQGIHESCVKLMKGIYDEYFGNAPLRNVSIVQKFLEMLVLVGRYYTASPNRFAGIRPVKQQEYTEKFMSICNYLNQHCTEDLTLEEVADLAGFSKYHFSRLFKEFAGMPFYKYLNTRRIAYSEKLLLDPEINVTEVAIRSGFNSISAFMRMFKIVRNCTPTQFRNLNNAYKKRF
ncbi:MAG: helix-turn-helix transcriptional regulator [Lachnospiraceae bacterium]|nr:helix-turn-helix transcriptional regulator [Lachnospiraceae bacterium]